MVPRVAHLLPSPEATTRRPAPRRPAVLLPPVAAVSNRQADSPPSGVTVPVASPSPNRLTTPVVTPVATRQHTPKTWRRFPTKSVRHVSGPTRQIVKARSMPNTVGFQPPSRIPTRWRVRPGCRPGNLECDGRVSLRTPTTLSRKTTAPSRPSRLPSKRCRHPAGILSPHSKSHRSA